MSVNWMTMCNDMRSLSICALITSPPSLWLHSLWLFPFPLLVIFSSCSCYQGLTGFGAGMWEWRHMVVDIKWHLRNLIPLSSHGFLFYFVFLLVSSPPHSFPTLSWTFRQKVVFSRWLWVFCFTVSFYLWLSRYPTMNQAHSRWPVNTN